MTTGTLSFTWIGRRLRLAEGVARRARVDDLDVLEHQLLLAELTLERDHLGDGVARVDRFGDRRLDGDGHWHGLDLGAPG